MLTLNTGQTPMSLRQQIEMLYFDYLDNAGLPNVKFVREGAVFVTFCCGCLDHLPESIRDIVVRHCLHDQGTKAMIHAVVVMPDHASVITSKAANGYHFKTGQRDWPSGTENVLPCRLLWWQVGFGAPASRAALEHVTVVQ
jgi:hypothetical protein